MLPLEQLQRAFAAAVIGHPARGASAVAPATLAPERLLAIYRNHFLVTLDDALIATFPTVRAIVGPDFFDQLARSFVLTSPPTSPCLHEYGAGFSGFLAVLTEARDQPYLPDVARLEWALNVAYHAADAEPLGLEKLAAVAPASYPQLRFSVHPALQLVVSPYPLTAIWHAAQPQATTDERVDLDSGGEALLITRDGDDVAFQKIDAAHHRFLRALMDREPVARAAAIAAEVGPFDLLSALHCLFDIGAFTDCIVHPNPNQGAPS